MMSYSLENSIWLISSQTGSTLRTGAATRMDSLDRRAARARAREHNIPGQMSIVPLGPIRHHPEDGHEVRLP